MPPPASANEFLDLARKSRVLDEEKSRMVAVGADPLPVPLRGALREVEVAQDVEERGVQRLAGTALALELGQQPVLPGGAGFEEPQEGLPKRYRVARVLQGFTDRRASTKPAEVMIAARALSSRSKKRLGAP